MPAINVHISKSLEKTGKEFREVHEWLDSDPLMKAERHDITRMFEFGRMIEGKYGVEARDEYVRHLNDDLKAKFDHLKDDIDKAIADTLTYFGVK